MMTCGKTGRAFKARLFMGVVYYQALKHRVSKKIHSRSSGKVQVLTGQPISGRSKKGGMRVGEMERDCYIAHGASSVIRERLVEASDKYVSEVCLGCGAFCIGQCRACKKQTKTVIVPCAMKLLFQELMAFGIFPKIQVA
jgi:DNA-directed RNA polymerase beta subunit